MSAPDRANDPKRRPEVLDMYKTHKSGVEGVILETVPNPSGTTRLRLVTPSLDTRWTTHVPKED